MNFELTETYAPLTCYKCGVVFGVPELFRDKRVLDKETFWCPNGHPQCFSGDKAAVRIKKLEETLARKTEELRAVATGKCPYCWKIVKDLSGHIRNKHKELLCKD